MLFYNLNFLVKHQIDEESYIPAIILNPTGYARSNAYLRTIRVLRKRLGATRILVDPQLYFLDLQRFRDGAVPLDKFINRVATYAWLGVGRDDLESGELRQEVVGAIEPTPAQMWAGRKQVTGPRWETTVRAALGYQLDLACEALILPSPLYSNHATTLDEEMERLRAAIAIAQTMNAHRVPLYASLPLADSLFAHGTDVSDRFINGLVDNVSAIPGLHGVYIPFIQNRAATDRISNEEVSRGLLRLAKLIATCTDLKAIFNFIGDLGLICRAMGAEGYATGPSRNQRQFTADEFLASRGLGSPKFFSLQLCADFRPEHEMEWIRDAGLLLSLASDRTEPSEPLFKALESGNSVGGNVPQWAAETHGLAATRRHYFAQQVKAIARVDSPSTALEWMAGAASEYGRIQSICLTKNDQHTFSIPATHHQPWLSALRTVAGMSFR